MRAWAAADFVRFEMQTACVGLDPAKLEEDGGEHEVGNDGWGLRFPLIPRLIWPETTKRAVALPFFCRFRLGLRTELDITRIAALSPLAELQEAACRVPDNQPQRWGVRVCSRHGGEVGAEQ